MRASAKQEEIILGRADKTKALIGVRACRGLIRLAPRFRAAG
jgi:hypothetical protein